MSNAQWCVRKIFKSFGLVESTKGWKGGKAAATWGGSDRNCFSAPWLDRAEKCQPCWRCPRSSISHYRFVWYSLASLALHSLKRYMSPQLSAFVSFVRVRVALHPADPVASFGVPFRAAQRRLNRKLAARSTRKKIFGCQAFTLRMTENLADDRKLK